MTGRIGELFQVLVGPTQLFCCHTSALLRRASISGDQLNLARRIHHRNKNVIVNAAPARAVERHIPANRLTVKTLLLQFPDRASPRATAHNPVPGKFSPGPLQQSFPHIFSRASFCQKQTGGFRSKMYTKSGVLRIQLPRRAGVGVPILPSSAQSPLRQPYVAVTSRAVPNHSVMPRHRH